jgi:hypothetical protein
MTVTPLAPRLPTEIPREWYGLSEHRFHPILGAPLTASCGGVIYFDSYCDPSDFLSLLEAVGWQNVGKHYAAFVAHAANPKEECFLTQLRIVDRFGLKYLYRVISSAEYDAFPEQQFTAGEVLGKFIEHQRETWDVQSLHGVLGGDGYWGQEHLAFGFMVESAQNAVCRIWSRAIILTK